MTNPKPASVDEYIADFPEDVQNILEQVRATIKAAAPEAEEAISYAMPAFRLNKNPLVYFAGFRNHIGFYATPTGHEAFRAELSAYKTGKGSVQFPLDKPMPLDLITRLVKFRVKENQERAKPKKA
ncbi:iron chaperone [Larkinella bovis]|uniref:Iron chaperone n=1 Tax=Larkinella bovis TaxID=683041 RepID=A0ABW0IIF9_9BACT